MNKLEDSVIKYQIDFEKYKNGQASEVVSLLDEANKKIARYIKSTTDVSTKKRYKEIAGKIRDVSKSLKTKVDEHTNLDGLIDYELKKQRHLLGLSKEYLKKTKGGEVNFIYPTKEQVKTAALFKPVTEGFTYDSYLDGIEAGLFNAWDSAVRTGYLTGQTTKDIVDSVMGGVSPGTKLKKPGTVNSLRNSIYGNTRTLLQSFANETRTRVFEENEEYFGDIAPDGNEYKYEYLATLDSRTCLVCGADDGKLFNDMRDKNTPQLPRHRGCRCIIIPYFNIEGDKRASKKGYKGRITFNDWLEKQDEKTKLEVLGKTRYELQKRKDVNPVYVENGEKLTLKQLSEKDELIAKAISEIQNKERGYITGYKEKDYQEKVQAMQDWLIRKQYRSGVERGIIYDLNGDIKTIIKGTEDSVTFDTEKGFFKDAKQKSLNMIHNHPNDTTLSIDDLSAFWKYPQVRSVSVVTKNGSRFTMIAENNVDFETFFKAWTEVSKYNNINKRFNKLAKMLGWDYNVT